MQHYISATSAKDRLFGSSRSLFLFLVTGICLLAGACEQLYMHPKAVPFQADFDTVSELVAPAPLVKLHVIGTGTASRMGPATLLAYPIRNVSVPPPFPVTGEATITAVNAPADQLFTTFTGSASVPDAQGVVAVTLHYTVTGGGGRFVRARGSLDGVSIAHLNSPNGTASLKGTITY